MIIVETYTATVTSTLQSMSVTAAMNDKGEPDYALRASRMNVATRENGTVEKTDTVNQTPHMLSEIADQTVTLDGVTLTLGQIAAFLGAGADMLYGAEIKSS